MLVRTNLFMNITRYITKGEKMSQANLSDNRQLMKEAKAALSGRWGLAIGATCLYVIIIIAVSFIRYKFIGSIAVTLIYGAPAIGMAQFTLSIARKQDANIGQLFSGFNKLFVGLGAYLLQTIFVMLWMMLLIIPGLVASLSYSMTYYIIAENESIGPYEAIMKSKELMLGHKIRLFKLSLRLIGLAILCVFTLGIGYFWLLPYSMVCMAKFYESISMEKADRSEEVMV